MGSYNILLWKKLNPIEIAVKNYKLPHAWVTLIYFLR